MDKEELRQRYLGTRANDYEKRRRSKKKWAKEQKAVKELLQYANAGDVNFVLDVPVGSGRFFDIYESLDLNVLGIDVSEDMLQIAKKEIPPNINIKLKQGDLFRFDTDNFTPDVVVCIRFLNWLDFNDLRGAISKMVTWEPKYIITGIRTHNSTSKSMGKALLFITYQGLRCFKSKTLKKELTKIHDRKRLNDLFEEMKLGVKKKKLVDRKAGTEKHIYLLTNF